MVSVLREMLCTAAWNYPVRLLSRAFNPFTPEILAFRNQEPGRIIVLYDLNDEMAASAANLMFEKGIDNVFVLNGGSLGSAWGQELLSLSAF